MKKVRSDFYLFESNGHVAIVLTFQKNQGTNIETPQSSVSLSIWKEEDVDPKQ